MKNILIIILIFIVNLCYASFPIYNSPNNKIIIDQNEIYEQYQDGLINQASYATQTFSISDRSQKKFLPNWKMWQKALLIIFLLILATILIFTILFINILLKTRWIFVF